MKKFWSVPVLIAVLSSCSETTESESKQIIDSTDKDTVQTLKVYPIEARLCGPMLSFANHIDSNGFSCDSSRLAKVYTWLSDNENLYGRNHSFYVCDRSESCLATSSMLDNTEHAEWFDSIWGDTPEPIIAYFFTDPGSDGFYIDGVMEQWKLSDSTAARLVAEKIAFTENIFGHNVAPMLCYVDDCVYVIYSRSTPAMYTLLPYFRWFVDDNSAVIVARENGWQ